MCLGKIAEVINYFIRLRLFDKLKKMKSDL